MTLIAKGHMNHFIQRNRVNFRRLFIPPGQFQALVLFHPWADHPAHAVVMAQGTSVLCDVVDDAGLKLLVLLLNKRIESIGQQKTITNEVQRICPKIPYN